MNTELNMVLIPAVSWFLFALGGTKISETIPGWKGWRRFILPAFYLVMCIINGIMGWKALLATIPAFAFTFGYGQYKNWGERIMAFIGYGLIGVAIGISWWNLITVGGCALLFKLSNTKATAGLFVWKICEGFFGALCGIQLAYVLMGHGKIW